MRLNSSFAIASTLLLSAACMTWQARPFPDPAAPATQFPAEVRVVRTNGEESRLRDARVENDSVIGNNAAGARIAIASSDVATIEHRRVSAGRTAGAVGGGVLALGLVFVIAAAIAVTSLLGS
jgi:hypothetical protein